MCVEHFEKKIRLRQELARTHVQEELHQFGAQRFDVRQLQEKCELTDVIVVIDARVRVARVAYSLVDLIGEQSKGLGGGDGGRNGIDQCNGFQSDEFFVGRARIFESLNETEEICTDGAQARTGQVTIAR